VRGDRRGKIERGRCCPRLLGWVAEARPRGRVLAGFPVRGARPAREQRTGNVWNYPSGVPSGVPGRPAEDLPEITARRCPLVLAANVTVDRWEDPGTPNDPPSTRNAVGSCLR